MIAKEKLAFAKIKPICEVEKLAFAKMKPICELEECHGADLGLEYQMIKPAPHSSSLLLVSSRTFC